MKAWVLIILPALCQFVEAGEEPIARDLSTRYLPYVDWVPALDLSEIAEKQSVGWWQSPEAIRGAQCRSDRPLSQLHLALDPGHIGGRWAEWEGRHFRIGEQDYWVREGELVLEVALRLVIELERLGARVSLLRDRCEPVNPRTQQDYWAKAASDLVPPAEPSLSAQLGHALKVRDRAMRHAIVTGEIIERARLVNESIRPDALISLHINAAPWPRAKPKELVEADHAHVLIFGSMLASELAVPRQRARLIEKLRNRSGPIEAEFGGSLGTALASATGLPAANYSGDNAIRLQGASGYLWARNLMLLRLVDCPTVMLEPYIANSQSSYPRIQEALRARAYHEPLREDDILIEYADAVVRAVLKTYGANALRN
jgi:hypothetical protein